MDESRSLWLHTTQVDGILAKIRVLLYSPPRKPVYNGRPLSRSLHHKVPPEDQGATSGTPMLAENPSDPSWCREHHLETLVTLVLSMVKCTKQPKIGMFGQVSQIHHVVGISAGFSTTWMTGGSPARPGHHPVVTTARREVGGTEIRPGP